MIINTTGELLDLRDKKGVITLEDDTVIKCDVPYSVGAEINGLHAKGNLDCKGYLYCEGNLDCKGYLDCEGDYLIITGTLYWSHASMPVLPAKHYINRVLPQKWQREYYQERLGIDISEGCYEEICITVLKQIINLLKQDKWTPTELWMLETLRDSFKKPPVWVSEIRGDK